MDDWGGGGARFMDDWGGPHFMDDWGVLVSWMIWWVPRFMDDWGGSFHG